VTAWFCCLLGAGSTAAGEPLVDPFLEEFRVGYFRNWEDIRLEGGWPVRLFEPLKIKEEWLAAAERFFAPARIPQSHRLVAWRLLGPAAGSSEAQQAWYDDHRQALRRFRSGTGTVTEVPARIFLVKETLYALAFRHYQKTDYENSFEVISRILARRRELGLSPEEVFVWSLRARRLAEICGQVAGGSSNQVWPELFMLGPYDARSGWAIWVARQRSRRLPALTPGCASECLAVFLAGLSRHWLSATELAGAGFPAGAEAAVGAVALPRGEPLDRHFARFDQPPGEERWQEIWLLGRRRQAAGRPERLEALAALPGLAPGQRLDLLRRASEAWLLLSQWPAGLANLEAALDLVGGPVTGEPARRLLEWTEQVMVLAVARQNESARGRILKLAATYLHGDRWATLAGRLSRWQEWEPGNDQQSGPKAGGIADEAGWLVRTGRADEIRTEGDDALATASRRLQAELWRLWTEWGLGFCAEAAAEGPVDLRLRDYRSGLQAVRACPTETGRFALACATIGRFLRDHAWQAVVLDRVLACDLARLAEGQVLSGQSPFLDLDSRPPGLPRPGKLTRHALLGVCLATGDKAGQVALTVDLPQGELSLVDRYKFLYPLPEPGPLLAAVADSGIEPALILALARNESLFDPNARSRAGALGWLQIMPFHYPDRGVSGGAVRWERPSVSVALGAGLLAENARRYAGDPYRTVAAYNAGGQAVDRWDRQLGGPKERDLFLAWIGYPETRRYCEKVLIDRAIYDWMISENGEVAR